MPFKVVIPDNYTYETHTGKIVIGRVAYIMSHLNNVETTLRMRSEKGRISSAERQVFYAVATVILHEDALADLL